MAVYVRTGVVVTTEHGGTPIVLSENEVKHWRGCAVAVRGGILSQANVVWMVRQLHPELELRGSLDLFKWFLEGEQQ